jgi:hypothetical protein
VLSNSLELPGLYQHSISTTQIALGMYGGNVYPQRKSPPTYVYAGCHDLRQVL